MSVDLARPRALRLGTRLAIASVGWMLVEAAVAIGAGVAARSFLLVAFGFDSVVELLSAIVVWRRLAVEAAAAPAEAVERLERQTAVVAAILLGLLCLYVVASSAFGLLARIQPEASWPGIAISLAALVVMPGLALAKAKVNDIVRSAALRADVAESVSCVYLAAVTLAGLLASQVFGWWWAQYAAAILLLIWIVPETREAIEAAMGREEAGGGG